METVESPAKYRVTGSLGAAPDPPAPVALVPPELVAAPPAAVAATELVAPPAPVVLDTPPALVADATDENAVLLGPAPVVLALECVVVPSVVVPSVVEASVVLDIVGVPLLLASAVAMAPACVLPPSALAATGGSPPAVSLHAAANPSRMVLTR